MADASGEALRDAFRSGNSHLINNRRSIVGLSIFSTAVLGVVGLYQTGILKRLPPHTRLFNPEAVHGSPLGFSMVVTAPDAVLGMASYAATACLAATGGPSRSTRVPVVPLAMGAKCLCDAALATTLAATQWKRFRTFSPWSLVVFAATCASLALSFREVAAATASRSAGASD